MTAGTRSASTKLTVDQALSLVEQERLDELAALEPGEEYYEAASYVLASEIRRIRANDLRSERTVVVPATALERLLEKVRLHLDDKRIGRAIDWGELCIARDNADQALESAMATGVPCRCYPNGNAGDCAPGCSRVDKSQSTLDNDIVQREIERATNNQPDMVAVRRTFFGDFLKALDWHAGHGNPSLDRVYAELLAQEANRLIEADPLPLSSTSSDDALMKGISLLHGAAMKVGAFGNMHVQVVRVDEAEAILREALALSASSNVDQPKKHPSHGTHGGQDGDGP